MKFSFRKNNQYLDVTVSDGNVQIELGLLDFAERQKLADELLGAADELLAYSP